MSESTEARDQRLHDLVRHQRGPLHDAGLITDAEYAALAGDHGAVTRLEGYDALGAECDSYRRTLQQIVYVDAATSEGILAADVMERRR